MPAFFASRTTYLAIQDCRLQTADRPIATGASIGHRRGVGDAAATARPATQSGASPIGGRHFARSAAASRAATRGAVAARRRPRSARRVSRGVGATARSPRSAADRGLDGCRPDDRGWPAGRSTAVRRARRPRGRRRAERGSYREARTARRRLPLDRARPARRARPGLRSRRPSTRLGATLSCSRRVEGPALSTIEGPGLSPSKGVDSERDGRAAPSGIVRGPRRRCVRRVVSLSRARPDDPARTVAGCRSLRLPARATRDPARGDGRSVCDRTISSPRLM